MHSHNETIVDQFTRQASAFATAVPIRSEHALSLLVSACDAQPNDEALDVACGPGLVVCAFAEVVRSATGIDLTPAMLEQAQTLATARNLTNVSFKAGDVNSLPFDSACFSIVTSRYAFHHFVEPVRILREMVRVCKPGGRIAVMDTIASDDPRKAAMFNRMEKLRDPSHAEALTLTEMLNCFQQAELLAPTITPYKMTVELEGLLETSFPEDGNREVIREMIVASLENDTLGVDTHTKDGRVYFSYPIAILVAKTPVT
jgi:ubiquinone/menaquinone biosynthesis C-methylase UbiE